MFELVARQTEGPTERFPTLAEGDFNTGMRLITPDGAKLVGADAAYQIADLLSDVWLVSHPEGQRSRSR